MPRQGSVPIDRRREPLPTRVQDTPPLPGAYRDAVRRGLDELGLDLQQDAIEAIDGHVRLLLAWTPAINLTAIRDPEAVARRHVIDSLAPVGWLREQGIGSLLDLGSGGGFPGIPLAAALSGVHVTLLEAVDKKSRFLATTIGAIGLGGRVDVRTARSEDLARDPVWRGHWDALTARAVTGTADLVELAFPLLRSGGRLLAWKRGELGEELGRARRAIDALGGGTIDVLDIAVHGLEGHRLVAVTRAATSPVSERYPRDPAARRRRPW